MSAVRHGLALRLVRAGSAWRLRRGMVASHPIYKVRDLDNIAV